MTCPDCHSRPTGRGYFGRLYCAHCERTLKPLRDGETGLSGVRRDRDGRYGG